MALPQTIKSQIPSTQFSQLSLVVIAVVCDQVALMEPWFIWCMHYVNQAGLSLVEILLPLFPKC